MKKYALLDELIKENKLIIFGAGYMGKLADYFCRKMGVESVFFLDNDVQKAGTIFQGKRVLLPSKEIVRNTNYIYIVAGRFSDEIKLQLLSMDVSPDKIILFSNILQKTEVIKEKKEQILYYPVFDNDEELTSHYYRACWYLPRENNSLEKVYLYADKCSLLGKPDYMGCSNVLKEHIVIEEYLTDYGEAIKESKVVLVWKNITPDELLELELAGCMVVNVTTEDDEAKEYGGYCSLIWHFFKKEEEKKSIIRESYDRFCNVAKRIKGKNLRVGCVFGTGPSLESSYEYDFSNCLCVVCNSVVQNRMLLDHIKPYFVTAGDTVSHLGVSLYAEKFRSDLTGYLLDSDAYFLTTAAFGYILFEQCSVIKDRIILVEQLLDTSNYDLLKNFALPKLDSTLNIHMLPIIHTFCDVIFINGCDGKCPNANNEDFWAHAETAQYLKLVETGHKCHPTFDRNRQKSTYGRYEDSTLLSIECGEKEHGKTYYTLQQSYITALKDKRFVVNKDCRYNSKGQLIIGEL